MKDNTEYGKIVNFIMVFILMGLFIFVAYERDSLQEENQNLKEHIENRYYCEIEFNEVRINSYDSFSYRTLDLEYHEDSLEEILFSYGLDISRCEVTE